MGTPELPRTIWVPLSSSLHHLALSSPNKSPLLLLPSQLLLSHLLKSLRPLPPPLPLLPRDDLSPHLPVDF